MVGACDAAEVRGRDGAYFGNKRNEDDDDPPTPIRTFGECRFLSN